MNNEPHADNLRPEDITLEMLENKDPRVTPELLFGPDSDEKVEEPPKTTDVSELLKLLGQGKPAVAPESTKPEISGSQAKLLREMAQYYLKNNISIIPVGKNKRPLIVWKEYQERKATLEEVDAWFKQFPDMQIGIVTGKISNLIVVDVEKGGDPSWLPPTAVAKTGGDGWHYYYSYVPGVTNKARIRELTDIRGDGGYCFTAGHRVAAIPKNKYYHCSRSVKIEDLKVGDVVKTYNEETGKIENKSIVRIGTRDVDETQIIKFGSRKGILRCTPEHPIFTTNGWKDAGKIVADEELMHFTREQLSLPEAGHKFPKGVQNHFNGKNKNYQKQYVQRVPNHLKRKNSNYEQFIDSIIDEENLPIKNVGDGSLIIKYENFWLHPDYQVVGKKKVIEVHCDFHSQLKKEGEKDVLRNISREERKKIYEKAGWECLEINASDWKIDGKTLSLIQEIRGQLLKFACNGKKVVFNHSVHEKVRVYNIEVEGNHNYFVSSPIENKQDWYLVHNCVAPPSRSDKGSYEWQIQIQPVIFPQYLFTEKPDSIFKPEFAMNSQQYSGAKKGSRNDSMARYIGSVLRSVHPSEWDTIGWQQVQLANSKNLPPLPDRELRTTFESIKNAERRSNQFKWQREQAHTTDPNDLWNDADDEVVHFSESARRHAVNILEKIPTGFPMFDEALGGGVNDGDLVVISGQTGHGKTTMAQTMTFNMTDQVFPCLWFSYEVLTPYLWSKFQSMGMREDTLVYIPFKHVTGNISWITKKILESKQKYFTKTVFIDHLGFLEPGLNDDRRMSRDNYSLYMGRICRELKRLAVQEKIIIVLLAHLKKTEEESVNDLYGSVAIGQESDAVFMVKRELEADEGAQEYFTPYTKITLMKNRKTGQTVKAWFTMSDEKLLWQPDYVPIPRAKKNRYRGSIKVYGERD